MSKGTEEKGISPSQPRIDTGLACLVMVAQFFRIAVDPDQIRHDLGVVDGLLSGNDLLRAAKRLEFRAKRTKSKPARLERVPLPTIAEMKDGSYVVLAGVSSEKALVRDPTKPAATELERSEFEENWSGYLIQLTTRTAVGGFARRFDFSWFIPEIVRYRRLFLEIMAVSFFCAVTCSCNTNFLSTCHR